MNILEFVGKGISGGDDVRVDSHKFFLDVKNGATT